MDTPNGDRWTSVVADWIVSGFINAAACTFAANSYPRAPLGRTLLYLGFAELARSIGYSLQLIFMRTLDDRLVNSISSFTYGSLWGITDILCIDYSLIKLGVMDPHLRLRTVQFAFRFIYVFIFATHWATGVFTLIWYFSDQQKSDNILKLTKFGAIGLLESYLIFRIIVRLRAFFVDQPDVRFDRQRRYERKFLAQTLARMLFGSLLYMVLTVCYFVTGQFPRVTQSVFVVDGVKRLLPTILVMDFLLTKIETMAYVSHPLEGDVERMARDLRET